MELKPLFQDLANAIREKDGTAEPIVASTFPARVRAIPAGGLPEGLRNINLTADPPEGGTVSGGGAAQDGMTVTVSAAKNEGYTFDGWKENGVNVFGGYDYTIQVERDINLLAAFHFTTELGPWNLATLPSSANWSSVTYGNGKFVAVAASSNKAAYSDDGVNWKAATLPSSTNWLGVT